MKKIEEQFKKDFEQSKKAELSFDTTQLDADTRKIRHKSKNLRIAIASFSGAFALLATAFVALIVSSLATTTDKPKLTTRKYTQAEIKIAESNTFRKLNEVKYPKGSKPLTSDITVEEMNAYNNFANTTYHALVDTTQDTSNTSYSVVGLYSVLNNLYGAIGMDSLAVQFDDLLGLNEESRMTFYDKVIKANSFATSNSTTQIKNAAFFTDKYEQSEEYIEKLTQLYCEAYQVSFYTDGDKIVKWANSAVNSEGFINEDFLEIDPDFAALYMLSTLYFKNAWANKYLSSDTYESNFNLANGTTVRTKFMKHNYFTPYYYDYGSYISVKDYYANGAGSITYLVPASDEGDIFDLTKDVNIFNEDTTKKVVPNKKDEIMVRLMAPKFKSKIDVDFKKCFEQLNMGNMFKYGANLEWFNNAFSEDDIGSFYMNAVKQRNEVEFNEDGTVVKSVTVAAVNGAKAAPPQLDTLTVKLDQPFIYIIRDANDVPIFVGNMDNPTK